jgi:uncharacterized membrane protein (UPF0136 family)
MRKAAGIVLIILGTYVLVVEIIPLIGIGFPFFPPYVLPAVLGVFIATGGICCIRKRYWGLCLASALVAVGIGYRWLISAESRTPEPIIIAILGILPIIFVCIRRKEWKEVPA